jgi:hypothetical protein
MLTPRKKPGSSGVRSERMTLRVLSLLLGLAGLLLPSRPVEAGDLSHVLPPDRQPMGVQLETTTARRVNAPHFDGDVRISETAIFWFGRVTPTENYADVRVGYNKQHLFVHVAVVDRRLWYDTSPSPEELTAWDATTLYLDLDGNAGSVPDASSYRFDAQLVWWEAREDYQAAYQGNGSDWVEATVAFTTTSRYGSVPPNSGQDDRGWTLTYAIPFESLGLSGPPTQGTVWGLALTLHDRDDAEGIPIDDQIWPGTMQPKQPVTWGQLGFGMRIYTPPPTLPGETVTIRHGLDGATVVDADVGGSSTCGQEAWPEYFSTWGDLNYAGQDFVNIQNLGDIYDWPCFSKYYVTFPLSALPADKAVISATLTLHLWGGAGEGWEPGPQPSLIQVLTAGRDWDESTITWNNAPLALENVAATWVEPVDGYPGRPGIPYHWDVSSAVAEAHASHGPLRLVLYESDWAYHSGKYFDSCEVNDFGAEGRPTLRVTWGEVLGDIGKTATPISGSLGDPIAYELSFYGTDKPLTLTDTLPAGMGPPAEFEVSGTSVPPVYDSAHHRLTWGDTPAAGQQVRIRYRAEIATNTLQALVNRVELHQMGEWVSNASATVCANCYGTFVPLVHRSIDAK